MTNCSIYYCPSYTPTSLGWYKCIYWGKMWWYWRLPFYHYILYSVDYTISLFLVDFYNLSFVWLSCHWCPHGYVLLWHWYSHKVAARYIKITAKLWKNGDWSYLATHTFISYLYQNNGFVLGIISNIITVSIIMYKR